MTPQVPSSRTSPALIVVAVLAGLQFIAQGAALADFVPAKVVALVGLILAGVTLTVQLILRGQVTPWEDVAAKVDGQGGLVAGPAANGLPPGAVVEDSGQLRAARGERGRLTFRTALWLIALGFVVVALIAFTTT